MRGAVEAACVEGLREAVESIQGRVGTMSEAERARLVFERDLPADRRGGVPADGVGDAIFILGEPFAFDARFAPLLTHPAIVGMARALLQSDALVAHFMNVTLKHPGFGRSIGWHRDFPNAYICPAAPDFLRLMLCLDGMDAHMGGTAFVSGSHRVSDDAARQAKKLGPAPPVDESAVRVQVCAQGDLVAIHPKVLHGGGMNMGVQPRRNVVLQIGLASAALVTHAREAITGLAVELR